MNRSPVTIAAELSALREKANTAFVPVNIIQALDLVCEFTLATAATLDAAGLIPAELEASAKPAA